jgi:hypothetical protein
MLVDGKHVRVCGGRKEWMNECIYLENLDMNFHIKSIKLFKNQKMECGIIIFLYQYVINNNINKK